MDPQPTCLHASNQSVTWARHYVNADLVQTGPKGAHLYAFGTKICTFVLLGLVVHFTLLESQRIQVWTNNMLKICLQVSFKKFRQRAKLSP